jgi:hypothetical protein
MKLIDACALQEEYKARHSGKRLLLIDVAPTVDAVPVVHGRWNCSDDAYESAVCSACGWDTTEPWAYIKEWFKFCPNCGARMERKNGDGND